MFTVCTDEGKMWKYIIKKISSKDSIQRLEKKKPKIGFTQNRQRLLLS